MTKTIEKALEAQARAYAPYSRYPVGAAIRMQDGTIIQGCNVENASYPLGICAERTALFSMIAQGYKGKDVVCLVIAANAPDLDKATPCGACRQVMAELLLPETPVLVTNGSETRTYTVAQLLPFAFSL